MVRNNSGTKKSPLAKPSTGMEGVFSIQHPFKPSPSSSSKPSREVKQGGGARSKSEKSRLRMERLRQMMEDEEARLSEARAEACAAETGRKRSKSLPAKKGAKEQSSAETDSESGTDNEGIDPNWLNEGDEDLHLPHDSESEVEDMSDVETGVDPDDERSLDKAQEEVQAEDSDDSETELPYGVSAKEWDEAPSGDADWSKTYRYVKKLMC